MLRENPRILSSRRGAMLRHMKTTIIANIVSAIFGLGIATSCLAEEAKYMIKEEEPRTGSRIRQTAMEIKGVDPKKRYSQLSAEERARLHSWWESIPDGDEPPFPEKGLKPIHEMVYKAQQKLQVQGNIYLFATVDPKGDVIEVKAVDSASPEMTKFAGTVIALTKFKPAICSGKPCQMDFPVRYHFTLH